jgi:Recombination endonuclease VII
MTSVQGINNKPSSEITSQSRSATPTDSLEGTQQPTVVTEYEAIINSTDSTNLLEEMCRASLDKLASQKVCRVCKEEKPRSLFPRHRHSHDGFDSRCRDCKNRQSRLREAFKREHPSPPPGPCPLCRKHTDRWVLDHCHLTDEMRGFLCDRCNTSLGGFDDDPEFLERATAWVRHGGPTEHHQSFHHSPPRHLL